MKTYRPDLCFKGARRYVHGTTLYEHILGGAESVGLGKPAGALKIDFRAMLCEQADLHYRDPGEAATVPAAAAVGFGLTIEGEAVGGWVVANGGPVRTIRPYAEDEILSRARIRDAEATLSAVPAYSPIEISTCLAVRLHQSLYPPPAGMKWLLARVALKRPLADADRATLAVRLRRRIGDTFTDTGIAAGGEELGSFGFFLTRVDDS